MKPIAAHERDVTCFAEGESSRIVTEKVSNSATLGTDVGSLYLGTRLRHARKVKRLRLAELAERVGCSESFLSKLENEKGSPSLKLLKKLAEELGTSIGALIDESPSEDGVFLRNGERMNIEILGGGKLKGEVLESLTPSNEARLLFGSIHHIEPGGGSGGSYSHEGEEVGYVLEGALEITVAGKKHRLKEGDSFFFNSQLDHSYRNPTKKKASVLWVSTPISL